MSLEHDRKLGRILYTISHVLLALFVIALPLLRGSDLDEADGFYLIFGLVLFIPAIISHRLLGREGGSSRHGSCLAAIILALTLFIVTIFSMFTMMAVVA